MKGTLKKIFVLSDSLELMDITDLKMEEYEKFLDYIVKLRDRYYEVKRQIEDI